LDIAEGQSEENFDFTALTAMNSRHPSLIASCCSADLHARQFSFGTGRLDQWFPHIAIDSLAA
jgi:hypothetical protein